MIWNPKGRIRVHPAVWRDQLKQQSKQNPQRGSSAPRVRTPGRIKDWAFALCMGGLTGILLASASELPVGQIGLASALVLVLLGATFRGIRRLRKESAEEAFRRDRESR